MRSRGRPGSFRVEELELRIAPAIFAPLPNAPDDPSNPSSLGAAIAAADSNADASNTIMLGAGTYPIGVQPSNDPLVIADQSAQVPAKTFVIEGVGGQTTITNSGQAFQIMGAAGASVSVMIENLTISGGVSIPLVGGLGGSSLTVEGAAVSLDQVTIANEYVIGASFHTVDPLPGGGQTSSGAAGNAYGGAVYLASGTLTLQDDTFTGDTATGGEGGGSGYGGAIYVAGGALTANNVDFSNDGAVGGAPAPSATGSGGSLYIAGGSVALSNVSITSSYAEGGDGGSATFGNNGGDALGGAIAIVGGTLSLDQVNIGSSRAVAGNGGDGGHSFGATGTNVFGGGNGGDASGGGLAIENATVTALDSTIAGNVVQAGIGGVDEDPGGQSNDGINGVTQGADVSNVGGTFTATTTPTSTPTPTPVPSPAATPLVTVLGAQWQTQKVGARKSSKVLVVTFSAALDAGTAQDRHAYQLLSAPRPGKFTRHDRLTAAVYDPTTDTVTLSPQGGKIPGGPLELEIATSSLLDSLGRPVTSNSGANDVIRLTASHRQ